MKSDPRVDVTDSLMINQVTRIKWKKILLLAYHQIAFERTSQQAVLDHSVTCHACQCRFQPSFRETFTPTLPNVSSESLRV